MEATVTSKGQVTLPKALRDKLDIKPGEKLAFFIRADGTTEFVVRRNNLGAVVGMLKPRTGNGATIEDLSVERLIAKGQIDEDATK